jgi:Subtilase family
MTLDPTHGARRVGLAAAVTCAAVVVAVPVTGPVVAASPCGPLGNLVEYDLNDRCDFGTGQDPLTVESADVVAALSEAGLFATTLKCDDGSEGFVVARPDELVVTAASSTALLRALGQVHEALGESFVEASPINGLAASVALRPCTIDAEFLTTRIPALQGATWSTDLDYLEPASPNNGFSPYDNPLEAQKPSDFGVGGRGSVLVLDSPAEPGRYPADPDVVTSSAGPNAVYDVDGNGLIDEVHGHGVFVASLVKRLAPDAEVVLYGVDGDQVSGSARWSPMMFSDADLMRSMGAAFGLSASGTAVGRTFDVVNLSLGGSGCGGVAARLGLGRFMRDLARTASRLGVQPTYVAAAGNDGGEIRQFPAAFRDKATMAAAADAIDKAAGTSPSPQGNAVRQLATQLTAITYAVGSWTGGVRDSFSNCGDWVDAYAAGADAVSRYPSPTGWASWSGTSFATPQISATLVGGSTTNVKIAPGAGAC